MGENPTQSEQCAAHPGIAHKSQRSLAPSAISLSRRAPGVSASNIHIIKDAPNEFRFLPSRGQRGGNELPPPERPQRGKDSRNAPGALDSSFSAGPGAQGPAGVGVGLDAQRGGGGLAWVRPQEAPTCAAARSEPGARPRRAEMDQVKTAQNTARRSSHLTLPRITLSSRPRQGVNSALASYAALAGDTGSSPGPGRSHMPRSN
ncbi:uncharacterized protein LOC133091783 [Eubalaena glacialis]|uniref:uncharacterized protein LOC133091783 n=1 Tax=Eubalaena glacialis TaxID=27606 RepID=UPI002A5AEEF4|nr:uncharacterized protein LOC133091783 [Eubalaena glacialis]